MASSKIQLVKIVDFTVTEAAADNKEAVKEDIKKLMKLIDPEIDESALNVKVRIFSVLGHTCNTYMFSWRQTN